jgi:Pyruvate/2-oxoacid:ferredoxin oxidoreductase delta subunit
MGQATGPRSGRPGREKAAAGKPVAFIDTHRCDRAAGCPVSRICPKKAVVPSGEPAARPTSFLSSLFGGPGQVGGWTVDESKCSGCLLCAQYCPHGAVVPRERRAS